MNPNLVAICKAVVDGARTHREIARVANIGSTATTRWWVVKASSMGLLKFDTDRVATIRRGERLVSWTGEDGCVRVGIAEVME